MGGTRVETLHLQGFLKYISGGLLHEIGVKCISLQSGFYVFRIMSGNSVLRLAFALLMVLITQDTSNVRLSVQAMILREYRSMILVR